MKKLSDTSVLSFAQSSKFAVIMFGATEGEATMAQALEFADAWADHRDHASFGYLDALREAAARAFAIRVLPTTLILHAGMVSARLEGRIASALTGAIPRADAA